MRDFTKEIVSGFGLMLLADVEGWVGKTIYLQAASRRPYRVDAETMSSIHEEWLHYAHIKSVTILGRQVDHVSGGIKHEIWVTIDSNLSIAGAKVVSLKINHSEDNNEAEAHFASAGEEPSAFPMKINYKIIK